MDVNVNLTSSLEKYLKVIYLLLNTEKEAKVTTISKKLNCSKPSVNRALNTLRNESLIEYEAYGDITLTKKGKEIAKNIVKRYDTLKLFLTEVLEIEDELATIEAEHMKHSVSIETVDKLEAYINKILDLGDLECCYDSNNTKCKTCVKLTAKNRLKKEEVKLNG